MSLRAVVIGSGQAGRFFAAVHARCAEAPLAAVCDTDLSGATRLGKLYGVPAYDDLERMFREVQPEMVSIASPERQHADQAIAALRHGCHVLCEPVLGHTLEAAHQVADAARAADRRLAVAMHFRWLPLIQWIKQSLDAGYLGRPIFLTVHANSFCWHPMLDLIHYLLGRPESVQSVQQHEPGLLADLWPDRRSIVLFPTRMVTATFSYHQGHVAVITSSAYQRYDREMFDLKLVTEQATLRIDSTRKDRLAGQLRIETATELPPLPAADAAPNDLQQAVQRSLELFVSTVKSGTPPPVSAEEAYVALQMEQSVIRADGSPSRVMIF
ncbi:MAG: Gfo/Idh/MocA family oxidoreductase [Phycisphaeraceae bacterium]|nr:Gfo/Idh/MocA family oxidoreductase [Phycisphaeraceae bacterium]